MSRCRRRAIPRLARLVSALLGLGLALAAAVPLPVSAATRSISFRSLDGTPLSGTLYEPDRRPAGGVVLVHMLTRTRADWDATAQALREAGLFALTVDLRGHGASGGTSESTGDLKVLLQDVKAAIAVLKGHDQVLAGRIGLIGASAGANLAALAASEDPAIASLVLLSPSNDYRGLRIEAPLKKVERPMLLLAGSNDPYAMRSARTLAETGAREVEILDGAGHGTVMLARQPQLVGRLVDWFRRTLL